MLRSVFSDVCTGDLVFMDVDNGAHRFNIRELVGPVDTPHYEVEESNNVRRVIMVYQGYHHIVSETPIVPMFTQEGQYLSAVYKNEPYRDVNAMDMLKLLGQSYGKDSITPVNNLLAPVESLPAEVHLLSQRLTELRKELALFDMNHMETYTAWVPYCNKLAEVF